MIIQDLTPKQKQLLAETSAFAKQELSAILVADGDENWRSAWQAIAGRGLLRLINSPKNDGLGQDLVTTIAALEGLGQGCPDNALTLNSCSQVFAIQEPIRAFGTEEQKMEYLPQLGDGRIIGALALTEAGVGSDAMALETTAQPCDGGYVLNGQKAFVGMGPVADVAVVFANSAPENRQWGVSVFLVEATDPGYFRRPAQEKMGLGSMPLGELCFEDCFIPADRMLGAAGAGNSIFQHTMIWERSFILAGHVGAMARQLDNTIEFARSRRVGGTAIADRQSVSNRLADMAMRLETARLMLYRAASNVQDDLQSASFASMTNLHISEAFLASSLDAVRIYGGKGYLTEFGIEQDLRDAMGGVIYSGTSDIQREIISNML